MKTVALIPAAAMAVALLSSPAYADRWDNHETAGGILHALEQSDYVGTSLSDTRARANYLPVSMDFPNHDMDETGFATGTSGPERGHGEEYGSVLVDIGAR